MLLGLTGQEWSVLLAAIVPAVLAVVVVWVVWRWAKRSAAQSGDG
jgi:membrane protein implicated in regulation of membrane protease activity